MYSKTSLNQHTIFFCKKLSKCTLIFKMDVAEGKSLLESWGTTSPAIINLCLIYFKTTWALAILLEHMHKKCEINRTKIKGGCQSGRKVVTHNSKSDLPLVICSRLIEISLWSQDQCKISQNLWFQDTRNLRF